MASNARRLSDSTAPVASWSFVVLFAELSYAVPLAFFFCLFSVHSLSVTESKRWQVVFFKPFFFFAPLHFFFQVVYVCALSCFLVKSNCTFSCGGIYILLLLFFSLPSSTLPGV